LGVQHKKISKEVSSKLWEVLMMGGEVFEEFKKEVVEKAFSEGERKKTIESAQAMLKTKEVTDEFIVKVLGISPEELKEIKRKLKKDK
jgi:transcription initiation factor IIE alpha subunit